MREGDTLVVRSTDLLARDLDDLRRIVKTLTERRECIEFVKEGLKFTGDASPMANLMQSVMEEFAEFERSLLREGIALAKQRGAYRGRKRSLGAEQIAKLTRRIAGGEQTSQGQGRYSSTDGAKSAIAASSSSATGRAV